MIIWDTDRFLTQLKMAGYQLKLLQPKELPESGVTISQFKPWVNHLANFLQQDLENNRFLKGGEYEFWLAAAESANGRRILEIHKDDEDRADIDAEKVEAKKQAMEKKLLIKRNAQLGKMLQHIVSFVHYTEADDIDQSSTSLEWTLTYLRQHYNIEARGANFLKITEHSYKSSMQPQVFYKQFRTSFINNLRRKGEFMTHKGGKKLTENEVLSPSFEDAIVLWSLEKIDPRLPKKVRKDYEHRLTGNTYLIDLQVTIFQSIPSMLEDLNNQAEISALTTGDQAALSAVRSRFQGAERSRFQGAERRGSGTKQTRRPWSEKYCRQCHSAGKSAQVFESHQTANCGTFNNRDRRGMFASLKAMNLDKEADEDEDDDASNWILEDEIEDEG